MIFYKNIVTYNTKDNNYNTFKHCLYQSSHHLRPHLNTDFTAFAEETCRGAGCFGTLFHYIVTLKTVSYYYLLLYLYGLYSLFTVSL